MYFFKCCQLNVYQACIFLSTEDLDHLKHQAKQLVRSGVRPTTAGTYSSAQKRFLRFCEDYGLTPLPSSEDTLLWYVAFLQREGLRPGSVRVYLAAVRSLHIEEGYDNPLEGRLRLKRALRALDITSDGPRKKMPITVDILQAWFPIIPTSYDGSVLWAAMTLAFFGCLRASELCLRTSHFSTAINLCIKDVTLSDTPIKSMKVLIKRSKTDLKNEGVSVIIGCSGETVCAVCSMESMLQTRRMCLLSMDEESPLFLFSNGEILQKSRFVSDTRHFLNLIGLDSTQFSGHSYRAGSATSAALAGLADWEIKVLGRWSSQAYQEYIRTSPQCLVKFSSRIMANSRSGFPFRKVLT